MHVAKQTGESPEAALAIGLKEREMARCIVDNLLKDGVSEPDDMPDSLAKRVDAEGARQDNNLEWASNERRRLAPLRKAAERIAAALAGAEGLRPDFTYRRDDGSTGMGWSLEGTPEPVREDELFLSSVLMVRTRGVALTSHDGVRPYRTGGHREGGPLTDVVIGPDLLNPQVVGEPNMAREDMIIGRLAELAFNNGVLFEDL